MIELEVGDLAVMLAVSTDLDFPVTWKEARKRFEAKPLDWQVAYVRRARRMIALRRRPI